jgi:hypothetical protein
MSSLGSVIGDIGALTGSKGSFSLNTLTKDKGIESSLKDLIASYKSGVSSDSTDLNAFIQNYLQGNPQAAANTAQETNAVGGFYNGDVANTLAAYRAQQKQAGDLAVAQALQQNRGNMNRSILGDGGSGDSSWNNRYGIGAASQLDLQNQIADLNQGRSDYGTVLGGQIGNTGRRSALLDAFAQRSLVPSQARQAFANKDVNQLKAMSDIGNSNNLYGSQYNPTGWELAGNLVGDTFGAASQALSAYNSYGDSQAYQNYMGAQGQKPSGGGGGGGL